ARTPRPAGEDARRLGRKHGPRAGDPDPPRPRRAGGRRRPARRRRGAGVLRRRRGQCCRTPARRRGYGVWPQGKRWDDPTSTIGRQPMTQIRITLSAMLAWIAMTTTTIVTPDPALAQVRPTPNEDDIPKPVPVEIGLAGDR